jgi:molybdenum cofactor cytidylyltransferase
MKIDFIIMAAGNSLRFGSNKLLYSIKGRPMFTYILEQVKQAAETLENSGQKPEICSRNREDAGEEIILPRIFVVTRYEEILQETEKYHMDAVHMEAVYSPESEYGASYTVKNGLLQAGEASDYYMFLAADQPCLKAASIIRLIRETLESGSGIGSMCWHDQPGNPVMFHRRYFHELLALEGDRGGRKIAGQHPEDCYFCQAERKEELFDADTVKTMENLLDSIENM